jgi:hypothetical protein
MFELVASLRLLCTDTFASSSSFLSVIPSHVET